MHYRFMLKIIRCIADKRYEFAQQQFQGRGCSGEQGEKNG